MDWQTIHTYAENLELWSTIIVNLTAIFTGLIVAGRWIVRRVEPTVRNVGQSAIWGFIVSLLIGILSTLAEEAVHYWFTR